MLSCLGIEHSIFVALWPLICLLDLVFDTKDTKKESAFIQMPNEWQGTLKTEKFQQAL